MPNERRSYPRSAFQRELFVLLKHREGIAALDDTDLPLLREALHRHGYWPSSGSNQFRRAAETGLDDCIRKLPDEDSIKTALLIDFGLSADVRSSTAAGRHASAIAASGYSRDVYDHDRRDRTTGQLNPSRRTKALSRIEEMLAGPVRTTTTEEASDQVHARAAREQEFERAWTLLDTCRVNGSRRKESLHQLLLLADELEADTELDEARALVEFARYEDNRGLETYRLVQGVTLLASALKSYAGIRYELELKLTHLLLVECANLFLTGDQVPRGRMSYIERLVAIADQMLTRPELPALVEAQYRVALGEALKEKAMVTHEVSAQTALYLRARSECDRAIALTEDNASRAHNRVLAQAKRHMAVTYELSADKTSDYDEQREHFRQWHRLSEEAAAAAADVGDDFIRAYALLNAGSSQTRLVKFESAPRGSLQRLQMGKANLDEALPLLGAVNDARGQGWVYIHLCENTEMRLTFVGNAPSERLRLVRELETYANRALAHLKQLEDELGLTLAYLQLGKALYLLHHESGQDPATAVRLERATSVLSLALERVREVGFFREALAVARWLGRCQYDTWMASPSADPGLLVAAVNAQILGLCELYQGQQASDELLRLYKDLDRKLIRALE